MTNKKKTANIRRVAQLPNKPKRNALKDKKNFAKMQEKLAREITLRKRIEAERLLTEEKLLETYKHLGIINRQMSIFLNLNKQRTNGNPDDMIKYIVNSTANLSRAKIVVLYCYDRKNKRLCSLYSNMPKTSADSNLKTLDLKKLSFLETLATKKIRLQISDKEILTMFGNKSSLKYALLLPLLENNQLRGALFMAFTDKVCISTQELDFFEAFTSQAALVLKDLNFLKK